MFRAVAITFFFFLHTYAGAQPAFKTIVPLAPVVAGTSFQVQYVLHGGEKGTTIKPPPFPAFRFVAGPNIYTGSVVTAGGQAPLRNFVFTLEALRPGTYTIPGASVVINGRTYRSNDARIEVVAAAAVQRNQPANEGAAASDYFLRPGEDAYKKIRENLFVTVQVDRQSCYTGQPVLVTFRLYSRLESKSDIVKNPGFYGFTVYDMVSLSDKQAATETIRGKLFDVHTIRKVQLYPLQPGQFTVDAMQVRNKVEFSHSDVRKKTEQEIVEGIFGDADTEEPRSGTSVYETILSTEPVAITVKPLPEKNKPADFEGATGRFGFSASLTKTRLARNEEGALVLTVSGTGNFIQLSAPEVSWPDGIEAFGASVTDKLDRSAVPLQGSRSFRFPIVCSREGSYRIPPLRLSFFDTDSNRYRTVQSAPLDLQVDAEEIKEKPPAEQGTPIAVTSERAARTAIVIVLVLVTVVLLYWAFKKRERPVVPVAVPGELRVSPLAKLDAVRQLIPESDSVFYGALHQATWELVAERFSLSGSSQSKQLLLEKLKEKGIPEDISTRFLVLLGDVETVLYTGAVLQQEREALLEEARFLLEKITGSET